MGTFKPPRAEQEPPLPGFRLIYRTYRIAVRVLGYTPPFLATCMAVSILCSPLRPINSDMHVLLLTFLVGTGLLGLLARFGEPSPREICTILALYFYMTILFIGLGLYTDQFRPPQRPVTPVKSDIALEIVVRGGAVVLLGLAVAVIQFLGGFVLKKIIPVKVSLPEVVFHLLESRYELTFVILNGLYIIFALGLAVPWYWGLQTYTSHRLTNLGVPVFERGPDVAGLLMASFYSSLVMAALLLDGALRFLAGKRLQECELYARVRFGRQTGVDARAAMALILLGCSILGFGLSAIEVDSYVGFAERGMILNPTWGFGERRYRYDELKAIWQVSHRKVRNGQIVERPRFVLEFADGFIWTTRDDPGYLDQEHIEERALIRFVSARSKLPVGQTKFYPPE